MTKYLYIFILAVAMSFGVAADVVAAPLVEIIEQQEQQPKVTVDKESTILVTNANGQMLYIYNVAGVLVQSFKVEGFERRYDLNLPKGCYIIKVGKTVRKISVR